MDGGVKTKGALPPGYEDEDEFLAEARERFQEGQDADSPNRLAAEDDMRFFVGEQWDPTVKATREALGRPCLMINQLPQFVAQVTGDIRINKPAIKVRPAEEGDEKVAKVRQGLIRAIEHDCNASSVYANAAQSQVACGLGNFRIVLEYASDSAFEQNIVIKAVPNAFAVVWDAMSVEPTGKDARFCFIVDELPRKEFERRYPKAVPSDLVTDADTGGWIGVDVVRITEYWLMKERETLLAMTQDGKTVEVVEEGGAYADTNGLPVEVAVNNRGEPMVRKSKVRSACRYLINGFELLEKPYELPISRLPFFRVPGWEVNVKGVRHRFGLVRFAKDSARMKNYWRSVSAELLAGAPRTQWISDDKAVEGREDDFREAHRSGDPLLIYNQGFNKPDRVDPPTFPSAILQEAALNAQDMKDVTGIHDASLGAQSNETSGRAIMARDRQGDVATFIYPDNLKDAIREGGEVVNQLIPIVYDTARTIRVIGEDDSVTLARINDPGHPEALDITSGRYDVSIDTGPSYTTKRVEASENMTELMRVFPQAAAVIGDLYVKAQDWPMSEEIAKRLKALLPPGLQEGEDGKPAPPDPAQQAAAQMQQQMASLQLREAEANAKKAEADAVKAEAEAAQAEFEAERQSHGVFALRQVETDIAARFAEHAKNPPALPGSDQANQAQAKIDMAAQQPAAPPQNGGAAQFGQEGSPPLETPATGEGGDL